MNLRHRSCSAISTPWVESIFVSGKESWVVDAEGFGRTATALGDSFLKYSIATHPPHQTRPKMGNAYLMGTWSLQREGQILGHAQAICEDKPLKICRLILRFESPTIETEALSFLMTGVLIMSGSDILEVGILDGEIKDWLEPNSEMQIKATWIYQKNFFLAQSVDAFKALNLLCLSMPAWEEHPIGKLRVERLNYLKIRKARVMELENPKPKKVRRSLIARLFRPKISD